MTGQKHQCLIEVGVEDLEDTRYSNGALYLAILYPSQTKTHSRYRWWFRYEDVELYQRLQGARMYHSKNPTTYRMI